MSDEPHGGGGEERSFLSTTKGMVTGLTSLIVAVTGLVVACEKLAPSDKPASAQAAAMTPESGENATGSDPANETGEAAIEVYTGEGLRLEWTGKAWQLTSADGMFTYEEMVSTEGTWVLGFDKENGEYIRWPIDGGTVEYSRDDRATWITYGEVQPEGAG